jgi:hypothetical protein
VPSAIVDTSSLITLGLAERTKEVPSGDVAAFHRTFGGIDQAIEALVLYDDVYLDAPSVKRNIDALPELHAYIEDCKLVAEKSGIESLVYQSILADCVPHIGGKGGDFEDLLQMHTADWMVREVGIRDWYPSAEWRDIEAELTADAKLAAAGIRERIASKIPYSSAAVLQLLRTLYYDRLQQIYGVDLVLHPLKAALRIQDKRSGLNILDMFDKSVRKAFLERKREWLGRDDLRADIPMLTSFVLNKCKTWNDLPKVIRDVRASKSAVGFRRGLDELLQAVARHDNQTVDAILVALAKSAESWSKKLKVDRPTKKISVSIPIVGISTKFAVPDKHIGKTPGSALLVFLHAVVSGA